VLCAFGLLVADVTLDLSRSLLLPLDGGTWAQAAGLLRELTAEAEASLRREGQFQRVTHRASLDMRYRGQAFELNVPLDPDDPFPVPLDRFHEAHTREYGYALPERIVEIVTVRVQSVGEVDKPALTAEPVSERDLTGALFERASLRPGDRFNGEALVVQMDSTHYIAPGWRARVDGYHNLILERA
jgi:N-methylhydantoinase A/oxoprolinase/acetone carboxylase beta subunit